jgi:hypothetical protein
MTKLVISTIYRNTKPGTFRLSVLDNNSDKETVDMLEEMFNAGLIYQLVTNTENKGLESARESLRIRNLGPEYFIDIDNDCLPMPPDDDGDWIDKLTDLMDRYEDYAAIACRTQVMIGTGNIFEHTEDKDITEFPHPGGSLRIMRSRATSEVGGWQGNAPGRGSEERYICGKLREAGYKTGFATHIPTLHLFGTRGDIETDRWGYDKNLKPEETGHSDIWHPALANGDSPEDVVAYAGKKLTGEYFHAFSNNQA